jgi:hypothetical protein
MRSSLDWKEARDLACHSVDAGFKLLWDLDLGLCGKLHYPYTNAMQHQALRLALEQFRDTLWQEFRDSTLGLVLFRGSADHSRHFQWGEHDSLFCSRVVVDYLQLLAMNMPDALRLFVLLDCSGIQDLLLLSQLTSRELYDPFHLALKASPFADQELAWQEGQSQWGFIAEKPLSTESTTVKTGVIVPVRDSIPLRQLMEKLRREKTPFRVIPESLVTLEWDGLDQLYYSEVSSEGKRMLQGFVAAGGIPINVNFVHGGNIA